MAVSFQPSLHTCKQSLQSYFKKVHHFFSNKTFERVTASLIIACVSIESLQRLEYFFHKKQYEKQKIKAKFLSSTLLKKKDYCLIAIQAYCKYFIGVDERGKSSRDSLLDSLQFLHIAQATDALRFSGGGYRQFFKSYVPAPPLSFNADELPFKCHQEFAETLKGHLKENASRFVLVEGREKETRCALDIAVKNSDLENYSTQYCTIDVPGLAAAALADDKGAQGFVSLGLNLEITFKAEALDHPTCVYIGPLHHWDQANEDDDNFISTLLYLLYSLRDRITSSHPIKLIATVDSKEQKKELFDKFPQIRDFFEDEKLKDEQKSFSKSLVNSRLQDTDLKERMGENQWLSIRQAFPEASPYVMWEIFSDIQTYATKKTINFDEALQIWRPQLSNFVAS